MCGNRTIGIADAGDAPFVAEIGAAPCHGNRTIGIAAAGDICLLPKASMVVRVSLTELPP